MAPNERGLPFIPVFASFAAGLAARELLLRLCTAKYSRPVAQSNEEAALEERRSSNDAASSSNLSSTHGLNPISSVPDKGQPHTVPCDKSLPESFHQKLTAQELSGLQSQRSHRGTIDTCPSNIPSDINLPEQIFGEQIYYGSPYDRPEVLDFPTYAACRFLDTSPNNPENGDTFEALKTMSAYFLRADAHAICDCIQAFHLNDLLFSVVRLDGLFACWQDPSTGRRTTMEPGHAIKEKLDDVRHRRFSYDGAHGSPRSASKEVCAVKEVVGSLMHEIECILHEYLSFNWDRVEEIFDANSVYLSEDGLKCPWYSNGHLPRLDGSSSSLGASPKSSSGYLHSNSLSSDVEDLHSPSSASGSLSHQLENLETFEEYMAARKVRGSASNASVVNMTNSSRHGGSDQSSARSATSGLNGEANAQHRSRARARRNWRRAKYAVTRKITQDMLGVQRRFQTLYEIFSELNRVGSGGGAAVERGPVLLLLGGGMAAGKSTVREVIGHDDFWSKVGKDAVVIEADAIKNRDAMYKHLSSSDFTKHDPMLSSYVHEYSTKAAEMLLAAAVNQQKDIVFDGTMTWAPFVEQTIAMVRDHVNCYKRGPGYVSDEHGNVVERPPEDFSLKYKFSGRVPPAAPWYWEIDREGRCTQNKRPYRIELVGVTCDAGLAVARGVWRKLRSGRSVPISSQLRSHRLFSENWERLAYLVDAATLYHTGSALTTFNKGDCNLNPKVIAHRSSATRGEMLVNSKAFRQFCHKARINDNARCRGELFIECSRLDDKVPISHEEQMSTLRKVFRAADRKERQHRRHQPQQSAPVSVPQSSFAQ